MSDISEIAKSIAELRRKAILAAIDAVLRDQTTSTEIVNRLHAQGFADSVSLQHVLDIIGRIRLGVGEDGDEAMEEHTDAGDDPVVPPTAAATLDLPVYPRGLPGWPEGATHSLCIGHVRAFGRYDVDANQMTLLRGSTIAGAWSGNAGSYGEALENLLTLSGVTTNSPHGPVLLRGVNCASPACAASIVVGRAVSTGSWKDAHNRGLPKPGKQERRRFSNGYLAEPLPFDDGPESRLTAALKTAAITNTSLSSIITPWPAAGSVDGN